MHISWLGGTAIKLQTKNDDKEITIVIDPYKQEKGSFPRSLAPNIACFSNTQKNSITLSQDPFVVDTLGEMEVQKVMIYALPGEEQVIFKINSEDMNLVHLGMISKKPTSSVLEKLDTPDILIIPVGGEPFINIKDAADLVTALEPRIVIPIGYKSDNDQNLKEVEIFLKEIGIQPEEKTQKTIIKAKDLPQEETKLILLEKSS